MPKEIEHADIINFIAEILYGLPSCPLLMIMGFNVKLFFATTGNRLKILLTPIRISSKSVSVCFGLAASVHTHLIIIFLIWFQVSSEKISMNLKA